MVDQRTLLDFMLSPDTAVELQTGEISGDIYHTISIYGYGKLYSGGTGALEVNIKYKGMKMIHLIINIILCFVHEMVIE